MNRNLTATVLIVLAIGIYFTVTEGMMADAGTVKTVNDQYVAAIASADKLVAVRDQVLNDYKNLSQDDRDRLAKMVPSSVDNIRLIIDLNNVALKHGFSLSDISATANTPTGTGATANQGSGGSAGGTSANANLPASIATPALDTVNVSFGVTAPYLQFVGFMQDLESNLRLMDVTHLAVTSSDNGIYTFQVQLKTYWLRQQ